VGPAKDSVSQWWNQRRATLALPSSVSRYAIRTGRLVQSGTMAKSTQSAALNIYQYLRYSDPDAALGWLASAFGFQERTVFRDPDGNVAHAEMALGPGVVILGPANDGEPPASPQDPRMARHGIYVHVDDVDAHYAHAKSAGAEIATELSERRPGEREYYARDPEGYHWTFGTYRPSDS
jgi:uncharacterized glyoxalase superfamily protein PhnB